MPSDNEARAKDSAFAARMLRVGHSIGAWVARRRVKDARRAREGEQRKLSGRLARFQEAQRRRVARGLHEETAQRLAALIMNLDVVMQEVNVHRHSGSRTARASLSRTGRVVDFVARDRDRGIHGPGSGRGRHGPTGKAIGFVIRTMGERVDSAHVTFEIASRRRERLRVQIPLSQPHHGARTNSRR
jgi:signal transduction histidine kinase